MSVVVIRCSCGDRIRIQTRPTIRWTPDELRVKCDGNCRASVTEQPPDPVCAEIQPQRATGSLAAAFA